MHRRRVAVIASAVTALALSFGTLRAQNESANKPKSCIPQVKSPERHDAFMKDKEKLEQKGPIELVFEGDSITDGWRGRNGRFVFDEEYTRYNCFNTGIGGDRTEHLLWRIDHGELDGLHPKAVVLMIGTNNLGNKQSVEDTTAGIKCVVSAIHEKLPESKILLLAVFPRGHDATDHFRDEIKQVNEAISKLDGSENVTYLDIGPKFLDPDGTLSKTIMPDALHPNEKGYMVWAESMKPTLEKLMK